MGQTQRTNIWIDGKQAGSTLKELKQEVARLNREILNLPRSSDEYKKKVQELAQANQALTEHKRQVRGVAESFGEVKTNLKSMLKEYGPAAVAITAVGAAIMGVASGVRDWYENSKQMERGLQTLKALTGVTKEELKFFRSEALAIGEDTKSSAISIVEAFKLVGGARPELLKNKEALSAVTKEAVILSKAADMELAPAAQAVAGTMNQFNLGADQARRVINALAAGSQAGAAEIEDLTLSTEKFGTVAAANNVTVEESVALAELLANKNIKGAEAGTQIRNVLLNVTAAATLDQKALDAMSRYGVNLDVVSNKALPLNERLREMAKIQGDQNALVQVFGKENVVAGQTILQNVEGFEKLTDAVTGTNTAYDQYNDVMDNLDGDLQGLSAAWEQMTLSGSGGTNIMREAVQALTDVLKFVTYHMDQIVYSIGLAVKAYAIWKAAIIAVQAKQFLFNGGLKEVAQNFFKVRQSAADGGSGISKFGNTLKNIGWGTIAALIAAVATEVWDVASGAAAAREALARLQRQQELSAKRSGDRVSERQEQLNMRLAELDRKRQEQIAKYPELEKKITADILKERQKLLDQSIAASKQDMRHANERKDRYKTLLKEVQTLNKMAAGEQLKDGKLVFQRLSEIGDELKTSGDENWYTFLGGDSDATADQLIAQLKANISGANVSLKEYSTELRVTGETSKDVASEFEVINATTKDQKKAIKATQKAWEEARDALDKLIKKTEEFASDEAYQQQLSKYQEGLDKELFELKHNLDEKFAAEIETATRLSKEKGNIGVKAQEQLNALLSIKDEEYNRESSALTEKYRKEKAEADYETQKDANLRSIAQQESYEDALVELRVTRAQAAVNAVSQSDINGRRLADQELRAALEEQLEHEKTRKLEALLDQYDQEIISAEELKLRKEDLEAQHLANIEEMNKQSAEKLRQIDLKRAEEMLETFNQVLNVSAQFAKAEADRETRDLNQKRTKEMELLDSQLAAQKISQEEYNQQKELLDKDYARKKYELELKEFKKNQAFAAAEALIQGALAAVKAAPNPLAIALAAAVTTASLLAIEAQSPPEAPQYAEGGYHKVRGAKDGKLYNAKFLGRMAGGMTPSNPSLALLSEKGPEYFVPNNLFSNPRVVHHVSAIEAIRTNQFAAGGYTESPDGSSDPIADVIERNTQVMMLLVGKIDNMGVTIGQKQIEQLQTEADKIRARRA